MSTTRYCQAGHRFDIEGEMEPGNTIQVTVTPADGYTFQGWSDGESENPRTITIEECGVTYTARFTGGSPSPDPPGPTPTEKYTITVKANPSNGGNVTGGGQYDSGTNVTLTASANPNYQFNGWSDGVSTTSRNITVTGNATYVANFTSTAPTLSYRWVSSNDANVIRNSSSYQSGTSSTINLGSSGLYRYTAFVVPSSATVSGSYVDSIGNTIQLTFRTESSPFTIDSNQKFVRTSTGGDAPSGYTNAIIKINQ